MEQLISTFKTGGKLLLKAAALYAVLFSLDGYREITRFCHVQLFTVLCDVLVPSLVAGVSLGIAGIVGGICFSDSVQDALYTTAGLMVAFGTAFYFQEDHAVAWAFVGIVAAALLLALIGKVLLELNRRHKARAGRGKT